LFLSYGQRDAADLALRLCADLEQAGYDVWLDKQRIHTGEPWGEEAIRDGLNGARALVALLSPHSTRLATTSPDRLTSVCLNELYHAKFTARIPIVPVLAVSCRVPLVINELHYTDLTDPAQYAARLPRLLEDVAAALDGRVRYRPWYQHLHPLDWGDYLAERRRDFVGQRGCSSASTPGGGSGPRGPWSSPASRAWASRPWWPSSCISTRAVRCWPATAAAPTTPTPRTRAASCRPWPVSWPASWTPTRPGWRKRT
jgi:hypothetical protein